MSIEEEMNEAMILSCQRRMATLCDELECLPWWAWMRRHENAIRMQVVTETVSWCLDRKREFFQKAMQQSQNAIALRAQEPKE